VELLIGTLNPLLMLELTEDLNGELEHQQAGEMKEVLKEGGK